MDGVFGTYRVGVTPRSDSEAIPAPSAGEVTTQHGRQGVVIVRELDLDSQHEPGDRDLVPRQDAPSGRELVFGALGGFRSWSWMISLRITTLVMPGWPLRFRPRKAARNNGRTGPAGSTTL
jgi:hypothetical protein